MRVPTELAFLDLFYLCCLVVRVKAVYRSGRKGNVRLAGKKKRKAKQWCAEIAALHNVCDAFEYPSATCSVADISVCFQTSFCKLGLV